MNYSKTFGFGLSCLGLVLASAHARLYGQSCSWPNHAPARAVNQVQSSPGDYILGPRDSVTIRVLNEEEIGEKPYRINLDGDISLPRLGTLHVAGMDAIQLQNGLTDCFRTFLKNPVVTVSVAEFASQPVTVLGAVANPGVRQIEGRKTLFEVLSEAGGLKEDAGNSIRITRDMQYGGLPLSDARVDASGKFSVGEVSVRSIVKAEDPSHNIAVFPHDVITVPKAEMVYVVGAVRKSGGFVLAERSEMSVLELLSLAEGLDRTAGAKHAKILRASAASDERTEIPINLNSIIRGQSTDVNLRGNDILFVPNSTGKSVSLRALEAIVSTGSGVAIYHPY